MGLRGLPLEPPRVKGRQHTKWEMQYPKNPIRHA
jgi:hypothetical protein